MKQESWEDSFKEMVKANPDVSEEESYQLIKGFFRDLLASERARIGRSLLEKVKKQTEFFTEQNPLKDDELGRYSEGFNDGYMNGHAAAVGIIRQETGITENV